MSSDEHVEKIPGPSVAVLRISHGLGINAIVVLPK